MFSKAKDTLSDISDLTEGAADLYKSADRHSPRMKKEITVRSKYYSSHSDTHPVARTLMQLEIDCSLLKLTLVAVGCVLLVWGICSMKAKRRSDG